MFVIGSKLERLRLLLANSVEKSQVEMQHKSLQIGSKSTLLHGQPGRAGSVRRVRRPRSRLSSRPPSADISRIPQNVMTETSSATTSPASRSKQLFW